jgi:glycosyltransferase A (GT-A) superfamily protein (DUF2064 family)
VGGVIERGNTSLLRRPLTRETSTGRSTKVATAIRSQATRRKASRESERKLRFSGARAQARAPGVWGASLRLHGEEAKLHQRATARVVLRSSGNRGRARISHRLQMSIGGARPLLTMRD